MAHGTVHSFIMRSRSSRIYPGIQRRHAYGNRIAAPVDEQSQAAPYRREVFVDIPAGYRHGTEAPLLVVQDGRDYAARVAFNRSLP